MAQDLKDIIEHLNTFGNPADPTDPVCELLYLFRQPKFSTKLAFCEFL